MQEAPARSEKAWHEKPLWLPAEYDWVNILFLFLSPLVAFGGLTVWIVKGWVTPWDLLLFVTLLVASGMSITAGYHRYFAHRTYETGTVMKFLYLVFGSACFENSALQWSSSHRFHHRFVDTDSDPYDINKGFFWAHMGWIFRKDPPGRNYENALDLQRDPLVMWQHRNNMLIGIVVGFGLPMAIGWLYGSPWGGLLFGGFLRVVVMHHMTFLVNSAAHCVGRQPYGTSSTARNSWWLAFFTWGEGFHNYHHQYASDYRNGVRWYDFDPGKWLIAGLSWVGLTSRLSRARVNTRAAHTNASLSSSHLSEPVRLER